MVDRRVGRRHAGRMRRIILGLGLFLAACSSQPDDPAALTPDEDRQLNEAAASLDANAPAPTESPAP